MNALNRFARVTMRSPIVWGLLACAAFYGLIFGGPLDQPVMHRYFTHHPVEYGETLLFSVGMAALLCDSSIQSPKNWPWANRPGRPSSLANNRWRNFAGYCKRSWTVSRPPARKSIIWAGSARR